MFRILINTVLIVALSCWPVFAKEYSGSAWVDDQCKYYNGSAWVDCVKNRYDGAAWAAIESGTCSTPATGDLFNEGLEGLGYDSGETVVEVGTVNSDAVRPGTQVPSGLCATSLLVNTAAGTNYARIDEGTARSEAYARFYFFAATGYDASKSAVIFVGTQNNDLYNRGFEINFNTWGGPYISATGATTSSNLSVTADTWNYIDVHFVQNGASTLSLNGGADVTFTARNYPVRYYNVGKAMNGDAMGGALYFDLISTSLSEM